MNKEVKDLVIDVLKQLVDRTGLTKLAKVSKIRKSNTIAGKNIDEEMKSKVPSPFLEEDWCDFLERVIFFNS